MAGTNEDDYTTFFNNSPTPKGPEDWAAAMGDDTSQNPSTPYEHPRFMMEDYKPHLPEDNMLDNDVSLPSAEISTQESSQFHSPVNPFNRHSPEVTNPNVLNPSTDDTLAAPQQSIFGPLKAPIIKEDDRDDAKEESLPTTSYRKPIRSQPMFTTPIRSTRPRHDTPVLDNEATIAKAQASNQRKSNFQKATIESGSDEEKPLKNPKSKLQPSILESAGEDDGNRTRPKQRGEANDRTAQKQKGKISHPPTADDSDDEICIITMNNASQAAKLRWAESRSIVEIGDDLPDIKAESASDDENALPSPSKARDIASIIAKQQALLNRNKASRQDPALDRRLTPSQSTSPPIHNKKRRRSGHYNVPEESEAVNAAMRAGSDEDSSWMNDVPEEDPEQELQTLQVQVDRLARRENNGKISEAEIYELGRLRKRLTLKKRLINAALRGPSYQPEEPSLFVPADWEDNRDAILEGHRRQHAAENSTGTRETPSESEGGDADNMASGSSPVASDQELLSILQAEIDGESIEGVQPDKELAKFQKPRRKAAKNAREVIQRQRDKQREKERAKLQKAKARGSKALGRKPAGRGKAAAVGTKSKGAKSGKRTGQSKQFPNQRDGLDEIGQMMIDDLMNNDPIADRLQNPVFKIGAEPELRGNHTKATLLQQLLANIPEGSDEKEARSDKAKLKLAAASFGYAKVKAVGGKWLIKGMKSTLYHHQLLGAQWMIQRELGEAEPYGGLLADGMGLGKTVQTIACMIGNPPSEADRKRGVKATLIVVPSSVIDQWIDEIRYHADKACFPKVMHYKSSTKMPIEVLRDLDIVICSYHEVMQQMPLPDQEDREEIARIGYKRWSKKAKKQLGPLFEVYWLRIVLDEAHTIKNNTSRTSMACQKLRSVYRWCLTGTPFLNRLEELFPYLRFLKANYSIEFKKFQQYFCDPNAREHNERIATLLSYTMIRRTMKTTILGRAIITLPTPHPEIRYVKFSEEERIIYRITENRFRTNLNTFFGKGTTNKAYTVFLVQLLRLRQCTSHPFMLEQTIRESWTTSDVKELRTRLDNIGKSNLPFYDQCEIWAAENDKRKAAKGDGTDGTDGEIMSFGTGEYGHEFDMGKALKSLNEKDLYSRVTCSLCSDLPTDAHITDCNHIFCRECIITHMHKQTASGDDEFMTCPTCEKIFIGVKKYQGLNLADDDSMDGDFSDPSDPTSERSGKRRKQSKDSRRMGRGSKGVDALDFEPRVEHSTWVRRSDHDDFPLPPSVKTTALKSILLKAFQDHPLDKVVIYVQFRLLATIVGRICESEGWGFLYLTGDCSLEHRTKAIRMFRDDKNVKILIAGLKCGGLGLNFPWANRCISLDLWWNHAVEQQAFGRIFRIGQEKETYMTRIVVKNSVDMRLLSMQMHKLKTCDKAMDSNEKSKPSLSLKELARLFGFLRTDADGTMHIEADYDDED